MKKKTKETILIGIGLVVLSLFLHYLHYVIFKDVHHTLIFLFADIAFIPMEVFFTSFILDRFIEKREKEHLIEKLNMLIGVFYMEIGTELLHNFAEADDNVNEFTENAIMNINWDKELFYNLRKHIENHKYIVDVNKIDLEKIKNLLDRQKNFFITLITNENLTEHETFTEMIMSIMHLREELDSRYSNDMEKYEYNHIGVDISVSYKYLTIEWLAYMHYLKDNYPQLFLKALINNPFDKRSKKEKDAIYLNKIA